MNFENSHQIKNVYIANADWKTKLDGLKRSSKLGEVDGIENPDLVAIFTATFIVAFPNGQKSLHWSQHVQSHMI